MLSYNYYAETDLDSDDDQLVNYSKKYQEHDPYEDCLSETIEKSTELPGIQRSHSAKPAYNDELKVYCIEGTPLVISSASSLSDLRSVGISEETSPNGHPKVELSLKASTNIANGKKIFGHENCPPKQDKTKDISDAVKGKTVTFQDEADETPLMFSRSSSISSLNSFVIVDDTSSVSAISAHNSGIISPSELPDSPGELMSPDLLKSKTVFRFPEKSQNESILLKLRSCDTNLEKITSDVFDDKQNMYNDEGNLSTISSLSSLSIQDGTTRISFSLYKDAALDPNLVDTHDTTVVYGTNEETICDADKNAGNYNFESSGLQNGTFESSNQPYEEKNHIGAMYPPLANGSKICGKSPSIIDINLETFPAPYEDEKCEEVEEKLHYNSDDDENDILLESLVQLGMQSINGAKDSIPHSRSSQGSGDSMSSFKFQACRNSGFEYNSDDDENDILLEQLIQLGMGKRGGRGEAKVIFPPVANKQIPQYIYPEEENLALNSDDDENNRILDDLIEVGMSKNHNKPKNPLPKVPIQDYNRLKEGGAISDCKLQDCRNSGFEYCSDDDENDILLEQLIQLGMAKTSSQKEAIATFPPVTNKKQAPQCCQAERFEYDEDDDVLLEQLIQLGMSKGSGREERNSSV